MTEDTSPENLRKFLESDDPAMVRMGLSMAKGIEYKVALEDIRIFREMNKFIPEFLILVEENNLLDEPLHIWITHEKYHFNDPEPFWEIVQEIEWENEPLYKEILFYISSRKHTEFDWHAIVKAHELLTVFANDSDGGIKTDIIEILIQASEQDSNGYGGEGVWTAFNALRNIIFACEVSDQRIIARHLIGLNKFKSDTFIDMIGYEDDVVMDVPPMMFDCLENSENWPEPLPPDYKVPDREVNIIQTLGVLGDKRAVEPITKFLKKNKDWEEVQDAGKEALENIE